VQRLLSIYGGRAIDLVELAVSTPELDHCLDSGRTVLAAEVIFAIREEMARTLSDIVHRRLMIGLSATQGREMYDTVAALAAVELGWGGAKRKDELDSLINFSDSLTVS
jgi:glycerol-3-phosphate dehydrogenase